MNEWTVEKILADADAEAGPSCCDDEYVRLRMIMGASTDLLEALEGLLDRYTSLDSCGDYGYRNAEAEDEVISSRAAIAKARGEA